LLHPQPRRPDRTRRLLALRSHPAEAVARRGLVLDRRDEIAPAPPADAGKTLLTPAVALGPEEKTFRRDQHKPLLRRHTTPPFPPGPSFQTDFNEGFIKPVKCIFRRRTMTFGPENTRSGALFPLS